MALSFAECLREARSIPCFSGTCDYSLTNYLRDVETVLSLAAPEYHIILRKIVLNKLRGKALACVETLVDQTFENCINKLREEFGIKKSYLNLRSEAANVVAHNVNDLFNKLSEILKQMNSKFITEGSVEELYNPENNDKLIFDVFIAFLPCHIKTLLLQNQIETINKAFSYFVTNNLLEDIPLKNNYKRSNVVKPQVAPNYKENNSYNNNATSSSRFHSNNVQDQRGNARNYKVNRFQNEHAPRNMQGNSGNYNNKFGYKKFWSI